MAKQTGTAILAELKELNRRLGRIEQLLQPKDAAVSSPKISSSLTPAQLQEAIAGAIADLRDNSQLLSR